MCQTEIPAGDRVSVIGVSCLEFVDVPALAGSDFEFRYSCLPSEGAHLTAEAGGEFISGALPLKPRHLALYASSTVGVLRTRDPLFVARGPGHRPRATASCYWPKRRLPRSARNDMSGKCREAGARKITPYDVTTNPAGGNHGRDARATGATGNLPRCPPGPGGLLALTFHRPGNTLWAGRGESAESSC
jgi:hypothetical protein